MTIARKIALGASALGASSLALAQSAPTSAAQLASTVNMGDVTTALFAVAGVILSFVVISKGVQLVIGFVRRG